MITAEDVTTAICWHHELFLARQPEAAHRILAPEFEYHSPGISAEPVRGPEGAEDFARGLVAAYPDLDLPHLDTVAEAGKVVTRWELTGTAQGAFGPLPGNGRRVSITGVDWFEIRDGRIVRIDQELNMLGWLAQLGLVDLG